MQTSGIERLTLSSLEKDLEGVGGKGGEETRDGGSGSSRGGTLGATAWFESLLIGSEMTGDLLSFVLFLRRISEVVLVVAARNACRRVVSGGGLSKHALP